jgi:hypothetical protein
LVHVAHYERCGGIEAFLKEYVKEVAFDPGYPHGPLEQEAVALGRWRHQESAVVVRPSDRLSGLKK